MKEIFNLQVGVNNLTGTIQTVENPAARILIIHGFAEHQGRYNHLTKYMNSRQIETVTVDLSGHGLSDGPRGQLDSMDVYIKEISALVEYVNDGTTPLILYGHSMGALICATFQLYKQDERVHAFILSSPWFALAFKPNPLQFFLAKLSLKLGLNPTQNANVAVNHLTAIADVNQAYKDDELVHNRISPKKFFAIYNSGVYCQQNAAKWQSKALITHGTADKITSFETSKAFASEANIEFKAFEGAYHEPHNDLEQDMVMSTYANWIMGQL